MRCYFERLQSGREVEGAVRDEFAYDGAAARTRTRARARARTHICLRMYASTML
jgi:hypothetical protein